MENVHIFNINIFDIMRSIILPCTKKESNSASLFYKGPAHTSVTVYL